MHEILTVASLEAGKHVMCEARMAMNSAEGHRMLAASRRHPRLTAQIDTLADDLAVRSDDYCHDQRRLYRRADRLDARIAARSDFPDPNAPFRGATTGRCPGITLCRWVFGTKA